MLNSSPSITQLRARAFGFAVAETDIGSAGHEMELDPW